MLITVEGIDGAGKTTLLAGLEAALKARGPVAVARDPGGAELSERVRDLLKDLSLRIDPPAEALLYAAARAQLVSELVRPLLEAGTTVLLDRYVDSSLAYQGAARGLGMDAVRALSEFATGGLKPDRTLLLRIDPAAARARYAHRARGRIEREDEAFYIAIAEAYDALAAAEPGRIVVIDAGQPPGAVLSAALAAL